MNLNLLGSKIYVISTMACDASSSPHCLALIFFFSFSFSPPPRGGGYCGVGREIFHLLTRSLHGCSGQDWARLKPGASSISPMWVQGPQRLGPTSIVFPCTLAGSWFRSGAARILTDARMGDQHCNPLHHSAGSNTVLWICLKAVSLHLP